VADRFHVGQRVRVVWLKFPSRTAYIGLVGVVIPGKVGNPYKPTGGIRVEADGASNWCFLPEELEPIKDDDRAAFERFMVRVVEPRKVVSVARSDKATAK
jgi:hypothetical protein